MSGPDGGDIGRVSRRGEPVVHRRPDRSAPDRRLARAVMAGDEEHQPLSPRNRLVERSIDRTPGTVEAHPVKVDDMVRSDRPAAEPAIPATVESRSDRATSGLHTHLRSWL
jgi:hypothetical protein